MAVFLPVVSSDGRADPLSPSKSYANYPSHLSPGQKHLKATLNLPNPHLILRSLRNPCPATWTVDTSGQPLYIQSITMSARKIQIGQLWKKDGTAETYLVTRVYNEALSTIAVLRKSGSENENQLRVKVERTPAGQNLPGFTPAMEDDSV
jgi:hypothetical protein